MTLDQAVAWWGRLLSNLNTKRSRRRLKADAIEVQTELSESLADRIAAMRTVAPDALDSIIDSRRRREREWMDARLHGADVVH